MFAEACQLPEMQAMPDISLSDVLANYLDHSEIYENSDNELSLQNPNSDSYDYQKLTLKCIQI